MTSRSAHRWPEVWRSRNLEPDALHQAVTIPPIDLDVLGTTRIIELRSCRLIPAELRTVREIAIKKRVLQGTAYALLPDAKPAFSECTNKEALASGT